MACFRHLLAALAAVASLAAAAQSYPNRPIKLIVPDGPGSAPDIRARQLGARLQEQLGQPVVIDNRPGGSMIIGAEAASKAPPDGYTLFLGNAVTQSLNPVLFKTLPYRPDEDFIPITLVSAGPLILFVNPSVPAKTLPQLIALGKSQPGKYSYGVVGHGSTGQIVMAQLTLATGAAFEPIVYKATGQYVQDLVGGHLQIGLNFWSVIGGHVKAGRLRALGVAAARRLEAAPDIPTFAEQGVAGMEASSWQGIFVPTGTPREIVARLESELRRAMAAPEVRNAIIEQGGEVGGNTAEEFSAFLRMERARWKKAATDAKIEPQS